MSTLSGGNTVSGLVNNQNAGVGNAEIDGGPILLRLDDRSIRAVRGEIYRPPLLLAGLETTTAFSPRHSDTVPLTARQVAVLKLVAQGMPNKTIASTLEISEKTIKSHKKPAADATSSAACTSVPPAIAT